MSIEEMNKIVLERILSRLQEAVIWCQIEGDEIARLSLLYLLAGQEENKERMTELRTRIINGPYGPEELIKFWTYGPDLAQKILEEEVARYEEGSL